MASADNGGADNRAPSSVRSTDAQVWSERSSQPIPAEWRSRAPHRHANATPQELVEMIVQTKLAHQYFGPKKVLDCLRRRYPRWPWPADSTGGEILKRAGLVRPRQVRRRVHPDSTVFAGCRDCNQLWSADFKGDFALRSRQRCYPLTMTDNFSRYLLPVSYTHLR